MAIAVATVWVDISQASSVAAAVVGQHVMVVADTVTVAVAVVVSQLATADVVSVAVARVPAVRQTTTHQAKPVPCRVVLQAETKPPSLIRRPVAGNNFSSPLYVRHARGGLDQSPTRQVKHFKQFEFHSESFALTRENR